MPIQNGKYVAPTWVNGAAPAIDATELQAISDSIVNNEEAITAIGTQMAQIETGSYVGTGTFGASNPNTLTFSFSPKMVVVTAPSNDFATHLILIYDSPSTVSLRGGSSAFADISVSWAGTSVSFYSTNANYQLNGNGTAYYYCGIGE